MAGNSLNIDAKLLCPHGGTVRIISDNDRAKAGGVPLALSTDTFAVSGCPFQLPTTPPVPSPCVVVRWLLPDMRARVSRTPTLSKSSLGICLSAARLPQGFVNVVTTQTRVTSK